MWESSDYLHPMPLGVLDDSVSVITRKWKCGKPVKQPSPSLIPQNPGHIYYHQDII